MTTKFLAFRTQPTSDGYDLCGGEYPSPDLGVTFPAGTHLSYVEQWLTNMCRLLPLLDVQTFYVVSDAFPVRDRWQLSSKAWIEALSHLPNVTELLATSELAYELPEALMSPQDTVLDVARTPSEGSVDSPVPEVLVPKLDVLHLPEVRFRSGNLLGYPEVDILDKFKEAFLWRKERGAMLSTMSTWASVNFTQADADALESESYVECVSWDSSGEMSILPVPSDFDRRMFEVTGLDNSA